MFKSRDGKEETKLRLEKGENLMDGIKRLQAMGWIVPPAGKLMLRADNQGEYIETREKTTTAPTEDSGDPGE
jgi:hypothetical protein